MQQTVVKVYKGNQRDATSAYQADAVKMAQQGYTPTSQVWTPGAYGCGSFIVALLLCFVLIGILIFIYMLIVKPAGALAVTYTYTPRAAPEKVCPKCAEHVKAAASVCRFCGYAFETPPAAAAYAAPVAYPQDESTAQQLGRQLGRLFSKKPPTK